ncbi:MAG: methionyl-tRNA formyltransferase [Polyangiaceae bacterium]|nr:methionyl-tRNA formyltransferase [Polyangiaceae bacterium]
MRALFFGTPDFAVPCLDALADLPGLEVVGVVCQPDRPKGRGMTASAPPVKARAEARGIPVTQPTKLRTGEFAAWVLAQNVDVALVVAYGRILPVEVLSAPRLGCINVHASILPKYRGAAPITWAIVRGEKESGVTLMQMDVGMDTGPMLEIFRTPIGPDETAGELSPRLSALGAEAVRTGIPKVLAGAYAPMQQDEAQATTAPMLKKEDGRVDFHKPAQAVHDHVRGMNPWPGGSTTREGKLLKVLRTQIFDAAVSDAPGRVVLCDKSRVVVACGEGAVELREVQLEGKKPMRGADWFLGRGVREGDVLGS